LHQRGKSRWHFAGLAVDRSGRPSALLAKSRWTRVDRWVDRPLKQNTVFLSRSTRRSTQKTREQNCSQSVDPGGRPTDMHKRARPDTRAGRPGRSAGLAWNRKTADFLNLGNFVKLFWIKEN